MPRGPGILPRRPARRPPGIAPLLLTSLFPASIRGKCVGLVFHVGAFLEAFIPTAWRRSSGTGASPMRRFQAAGARSAVIYAPPDTALYTSLGLRELDRNVGFRSPFLQN